MKRIVMAVLATGLVAGTALAFSAPTAAVLAGKGYHRVNDWTYSKTVGPCKVTVVEETSNMYWVHDNHGVGLYPIKAKAVGQAADLAEFNCAP